MVHIGEPYSNFDISATARYRPTDIVGRALIQTHTNSLNLAAVVGFLQVLVQFDDPLLVLLLLNACNLLQLTGPLVLQHLLGEDKVKN